MWALLLTAGNLFFGFLAIGLVVLPQTVGWGNPQLETAVWCIVLAGLFDAIDGPVARHTHSVKAVWGREFDALADLVSFGVAPAVLLGAALPAAFRGAAIAAGAVYVTAGAWRLARFLREAPTVRGRFTGMPITAAGLMLAAYWLFEHATRENVDPLSALLLFAFSALLMASRISFDKFPEFGLPDRRNRVKWVIAVAGVVAIGSKPTLTGLPVALLYAAHGPVRALYRTVLARLAWEKKRAS